MEPGFPLVSLDLLPSGEKAKEFLQHSATRRSECFVLFSHDALTSLRVAIATQDTCPPLHVRIRICPVFFHQGVHETPRTTFREGTPRGDRLLRSMDKREPLFVPDLLAEPREYQPDTQTYKTFITAPVAPAITHPAFGMLAIDSPTKGDLAEHDIKIIEILGQLLGSALAIKR